MIEPVDKRTREILTAAQAIRQKRSARLAFRVIMARLVSRATPQVNAPLAQ